ncbi:hypothetical protein MW887_009220 [Aspergillus wentii]|nr:hypothetical protein MW887_009220 [Aspergillus wentii]
MMRDSHNPAPPAGLLSQTRKLQLEEDRFRFTPVKASAAPRVWDRKPSTSFLGRTKSRKVWKRFRTSFNSMKALQQMIAAEQDGIHDDLHTEINTSKNFEFLRGVKRRCLKIDHDADDSSDAGMERGRSFLETKWESEMGGRRRKLPMEYTIPSQTSSEAMTIEGEESDISNQNDAMGQEDLHDLSTSSVEVDVQETVSGHDESLASMSETPVKSGQDSAYPSALHGLSSCTSNAMVEDISNINTDKDMGEPAHTATLEKIDDVAPGSAFTDDRQTELSDEQAYATTIENNVQTEDTTTTTAPATTEVVEDLTGEKESTLVRSALRSSLDGEDAALLNNFLSKAQAKRAAKAVMTSPEAEEEKAIIQEELVAEFPTPRSRRALEELDANSPSPQKPQLSPCKADSPRKNTPDVNEPANKDNSEEAADQQQPASPVGRRSTRMRLCKPAPRTASAPAVRNHLSLRRAKGTEFVFLQRTEAQELALATRKNTRNNKGDAVLPKFVLKGLAQQWSEDEESSSNADNSKSARSDRKGSGKRSSTKKQVSWNDERLVEYEDGGAEASHRDEAKDDVADSKEKSATKQRPEKKKATSGGRSTRSQGSLQKTGDGSTESPTASTTAPATAAPKTRMRRLGASGSNSTSTAATSPTTTSSPANSKRKKLTPKSPSSTLLPTPASKSASTTSKSSVSGSGRTTTTSGKSKSILQANAGSTPMPRRIRSKA